MLSTFEDEQLIYKNFLFLVQQYYLLIINKLHKHIFNIRLKIKL